MTWATAYACRNRACSRFREERANFGTCDRCGWLMCIAAIWTWRLG